MRGEGGGGARRLENCQEGKEDEGGRMKLCGFIVLRVIRNNVYIV